jgi:hypothetical protein
MESSFGKMPTIHNQSAPENAGTEHLVRLFAKPMRSSQPSRRLDPPRATHLQWRRWTGRALRFASAPS